MAMGQGQPSQQELAQRQRQAREAEQRFNNLRNDPEFRALKYEDQIQVRAALAGSFVPYSPETQGFTPQEKAQIIQQLAIKPPEFENEEFGQRVLGITERARQGDEDAMRTIDQELFADRMRSSSLLFSLVDNHVFGNAVHEAREAVETGEYLPDMRQMSDPDVAKANQYMRMLRQEMDEWAGNAQTWETVAGVAANIAEFMALWKVGAGPIKAPVGAGKLLTKGFHEAASRAAIGSFKRFGLNVAGSASHAFATTGIGFAREKAIELSNGTFGEYKNFRDMMAQNVHVFGRYVAFDILTNMLFDIALPHMKGIVQAFTGSSDAMTQLLKDKLNPYDWKNIGDFLFSDVADPAMLKQYPKELQDILIAKHAMFKTLANVPDVGRRELLEVAGGMHNMIMDTTSSGSIRVRRPMADGKLHSLGTFKDLDSLENFLIREIAAAPEFTLTSAQGSVRGAAGRSAIARAEIGQRFEGIDLENRDILANLLAPKGGKFDPKHMKRTTQELLRQAGASEDVISKVAISEVGENFYISIPGQSAVMFPKTVATPAQEVLPIRNLLNASSNAVVKEVPSVSDPRLLAAVNRAQEAHATIRGKASFDVTAGEKGAKTKALRNLETELRRVYPEASAGQIETMADRFMIEGVPAAGREGGNAAGLARLKALADGGYQESLAKQHLFTPGWTEYVAQEKLGGVVRQFPDGRIEFLAKGRKTAESFANHEEFGRWVIARNADKDYLSAYLKQQEGIKLVDSASGNVGKYDLVRGRQTLAEDLTPQEILREFPELTNHAPASLGPELTLTDLRGTVEARWHGVAFENTYEGVLRHLDNFKNPKPTKFVIGNPKDGIIEIDTAKAGQAGVKAYEIEIPEIGYRESFEKLEDAKRWMSGGWKEWDNLKKAAYMKGYRLDTAGTGYALYTDNGQVLSARNADDLYKKLAEAPIPEWAPELSGLGEEFLSALPDGALTQGATPMRFSDMQTLDPKRVSEAMASARAFEARLGALYRPPEGFFDTMQKQGADPEFGRLYRQGEDLYRYAMGKEYRSMAMATNILKDKTTGKIVHGERSAHLYDYITAPADKKEAIAQAWNFTNEDRRIAREVRAWFDAHGKGFGLNGQRYLEDYLPRMTDRYAKMTVEQRQHLMAEPKTFWETLMGDKPPKELSAFFQHPRLSDVAGIFEQKDLFTLMHKYQSVGWRKQIFEPWIREFDAFEQQLKKGMNSASEAAYERLKGYRADLVNMPTGDQAHYTKKALEAFMSKRGIKATEVGHIEDAFIQWGYTASMGFRPWLPIRNTFQIFTTLDPWLGEDFVPKAIRQVVNDKSGQIYAQLRQAGVVTSDLPLHGMDVANMQKLGGRLLKSGMQWYKNSDDYTRAVAYLASTNKWDAAMKQLQEGIISREQFVQTASGLHAVREGRRNQILQLLDEGNAAAARHMLGTDMVEHTMFAYRHTARPEAFRKGLVGKLFGTFGTYPVQYVENVRQALTTSGMTPAQKAAWAGKFVANAGALYLGFRELAGIEAGNFLPWVPAQFAGGPWYDMAYGVSKSLAPGYRGRQARAEVFGITTVDGQLAWDPRKSEMAQWLIPFSFSINSIQRGIQYANEGKHYQAFLSIGSAPIRADLW